MDTIDFGDILMEYNRKSKEDKKVDELKMDVKRLKRKRDAMAERNNTIRNDINSGIVNEPSHYKLPLGVTVTDPTSDTIDANQALTDVTFMLETAKTKQKLHCHAISTGITAWKSQNTNDPEITFNFDPCVMGLFHGPYTLRMIPVNGRMFLRGHTLPHAVPTKELYNKLLAKSSASYQSTKLAPFLNELMRFTRAFISRQIQFQELREKFQNDLREFQSVNHCTAVSFILDLRDEGDEEGSHVTATILLNYEKDAERPKPGSLKVTLVGQEMTQDDRNAFDDQCAVFYTHRLADAVVEAF